MAADLILLCLPFWPLEEKVLADQNLGKKRGHDRAAIFNKVPFRSVPPAPGSTTAFDNDKHGAMRRFYLLALKNKHTEVDDSPFRSIYRSLRYVAFLCDSIRTQVLTNLTHEE